MAVQSQCALSERLVLARVLPVCDNVSWVDLQCVKMSAQQI